MNEREEQFRYNNITERYKRMNKVYIVASTCLWIMLFIYMLCKLFLKEVSAVKGYGNAIGIVILALINAWIYFRDRASVRYKMSVGIGIGFEFLLIGMQTDVEFIYFALIGILALQIPYYDQKMFNKFCIGYTAIYTLVLGFRAMNGMGDRGVDPLCRSICVYLMIYVLYKVGSVAKEFSDHALGTVEMQSGKQKVILDGIIDISMTVQSETTKSSDLVDELVNATEQVAHNMKEISSAANVTARNIADQSDMTQSIQHAIEETSERSRMMVDVATNSNDSIRENMQVMEALRVQSQEIAATNQEVTASMNRLQDKTKEVEEIAGMILNISSQTNLLALNASIESARAGEAGRGFAVVAEQIRQLAEQTKNSTEEITRIINELNTNANEVVTSVESSVEMTASQNEKIVIAAEAFEKLNANMTQLIENIRVIDQEILGLSDSNNHIVDNIAHLSAATEEVTASADQVREMSEQNLNYAEDVKSAIGLIRGKTDDMKQYL